MRELADAGYQVSAGVLNALDTGGEWFLDTGAQLLYLWTPAGDAPAHHLVEAKRRTDAFDFNSRSNIVVRHIRIFGATVNLSSSSRDNTIDGAEARYISQFTTITAAFSTGTTDTGFLINGTSNRVLNSIIGWSAGNGIMLAGSGHTVSNCVIHDVDYTANNPGAIYPSGGTGLLITRNTLYNSARSVLLAYLASSKILYNHVYNAGLQMQDLGLLYTYGDDGGGTEIAYNIFHGSHPVYGGQIATCLYLDNSSRNYNAHHNLCYDAPRAFQSNLPGTNQLVYNNTLLGDTYSLRGTGSPPNGSGTQFKNNIFGASTNTYSGTNAVFAHNLPSTINPLFVSATDGNFQLSSNSPAIDAGLALPPYTDGYAGAAPDLGAFEYGAAPWTAGSALTVGGFSDADIGGVKPPGGLDYWDERYTLQGGGGDIWNTADQFHFSYVPVTNDNFQVVARVTSLLSPVDSINSAMKCGVMIRETLSAGSRHATTAITPGIGVMQLYRNSPNGSSVSSKVGGQTAPIWVRIVRNGNTFTSSYSDDGTNWSAIGTPQTITMSPGVFAGLCLSSHTSGSVADATIESPRVEDLAAVRPLITGLTANSGVLSITATGGAPGCQWTLLQSASLILPLDQWEANSIVTFDAAGSLTTNIPNLATNAQTFYILRQ
jgi:hypothetical protein